MESNNLHYNHEKLIILYFVIALKQISCKELDIHDDSMERSTTRNIETGNDPDRRICIKTCS